MEPTIREYRPADLEACRDLWRDLTQRHRDIYGNPGIGGDDPGAKFDGYLNEPGLAGPWVAELSSRIVGLSGLLVRGTEAEVEPVVVATGFRSRGIGGKLLDRMIEEARRRGVRTLSIRPVARNAEAIARFHRAGFRILGHIEMFQELEGAGTTDWKTGITLHDIDFDY